MREPVTVHKCRMNSGHRRDIETVWEKHEPKSHKCKEITSNAHWKQYALHSHTHTKAKTKQSRWSLFSAFYLCVTVWKYYCTVFGICREWPMWDNGPVHRISFINDFPPVGTLKYATTPIFNQRKKWNETMNKHISARIAYLQNKRKGVRFDKSSSQANHQLFMPYVRITFVHRFFVVALSVSLFLYNSCIRRAVFMMNFNLMTLDLHKSVMNVVQTFLAWLRLSLLLLQVVYPKSHCSSPNPPAKYLIRNIWLSIKLSA